MKVFWLVCGLFIALILPFCLHAQDESPAGAQLRTWKAAEGDFSTEAEFVSRSGNNAVLRRKDGKLLTVPLERLTQEDRQYVVDFLRGKKSLPTPEKPTAPMSTEPPKSAAGGETDKFSAAEVVRTWNKPFAPVQLTEITTWKIPRVPDHFELSAGGELLHVASFRTGKHEIFQVSDGKLLHSIEHGVKPLTAAAFSPDGKYIAATMGDAGTSVYDIAAQKEAQLHSLLKSVTSIRISREEKPRIFASAPTGHVYYFPLLGGMGDGLLPPDGAPPKSSEHTKLAISQNGKWLGFAYAFASEQWMLVRFDENQKRVQDIPLKKETPPNGNLAMGERILAYDLGGKSMRFIRMNEDFLKSPNVITPRMYHDRTISIAPDDSLIGIYAPTFGQLEFHSTQSLGVARGAFVGEQKPRLVQFDWPRQRLVAVTQAGKISVYEIKNHISLMETITVQIREWLEKKQDERLEQVALELEKDATGFASMPLVESKYGLFTLLLSGSNVLRDADGEDPYAAWLERNPKSRLARHCRASALIKAGWDARGSGLAAQVTDEGWNGFRKNIREAEGLLTAMSKERVIPPATYAALFKLAKSAQWDGSKIEPLVNRMLKDCPENHEAHMDYVEGLMPRWGGDINDCVDYANRVAKQLGGPAGDAMYALMAVRLQNYHGPGVYSELNFEPARVQAGLKHYFRDAPTSPAYRQAVMLMALRAEDFELVRQFAVETKENGDPHYPAAISEGEFIIALQNYGFRK